MSSLTARTTTSHARPGFESGLVSVLRDGVPYGAGMLVDAVHVVTCTHVWEEVTRGGGVPEVGFCHASGERRPVELVDARPVDVPHGDVALLRLRAAPPGLAAPVRLVESPDVNGHRFEVWGFPRAAAGEQLAHGVLTRRRGDGLVQLEGDTVTGLAVAPGFSGAPVWDLTLGAVVGMLTSVDPDAATKTGYLIPVDVIAELWPELPRTDAPASDAAPPRRVIGTRPSEEGRQWYDRTAIRAALVESIRARRRIVQVIGRRGVGKSAVVTRVVTSTEDAGGFVDAVFLSKRTGQGEVTLALIVRLLAALLPEDEDRLLKRWSDIGADVLPDLFDSLRDRTVVVVLDSLDQLQDPDTGELRPDDLVAFLRAVVTSPHPVLVITTSHMEVVLPWELRSDVTVLPLVEGLPPDDAADLLRKLDLRGSGTLRGLGDAEVHELAAMVGGLPRGLQLLVGYLHDNPRAGMRRLARDGRAPAEVLDELVSVAYDRLAGAARDVVEVLAVAGVPLTVPDLGELLPERSADDVDAALDELLRRQEIATGGDEDIIRLHPLDTDHVQACLPADRAVALHRRLADWYGRHSPPRNSWLRLPDVDPVVAEYRHRWAAGEHEQAMAVLSGVAEFLARRGRRDVLVDAVAAASASDAGGDGNLAFQICRAFALMGGSQEEAEQAFRAVARLDPSSAVWPTWVGTTQRHIGRSADAVATLGPIVADAAVPRALRLFAGLEYGLALCYLRRVDDAGRAAALLAELRTPEDPPEMRAYVSDIQALQLLIGGRFADALAAADAAVADYAQNEVMDGVEYVRNVRGLALFGLGRLDDAAAAFEESRTGGHRMGSDRLEGIAGVNLAWVRLAQRRPGAAAAAAGEAADRLAASRTEGVEGARALQRVSAGEAGNAAADLARAGAEMRVNPDFHQVTDEELHEILEHLTGG